MNTQLVKKTLRGFVIALSYVFSIRVIGIALKALFPNDNAIPALGLVAEIFCIIIVFIILICTHKQNILKGTILSFLRGISAGGFLCGLIAVHLIAFFIYDFSGEKVLPISNIMIFVFSMLVTGFAEEIIFRGIIYNTISECFDIHSKKNIYISLCLSSIIFGMMHISNIFSGVSIIGSIVQAVCAFGVGLYFNAIYIRCNNIWSVIILHGLNDIAASLNAGVLGESDMVSDISAYHPVKLIIVLLYIALSVYILRDSKISFQDDAYETSE